MLWVVMSTVMVLQQPLILGTLQALWLMCWIKIRLIAIAEYDIVQSHAYQFTDWHLSTLCANCKWESAMHVSKKRLVWVCYCIWLHGILTYRFSRSFKGDSKDQDLDLNSSYYILYGTGDTLQSDIAYYSMALLHGATCILIFYSVQEWWVHLPPEDPCN